MFQLLLMLMVFISNCCGVCVTLHFIHFCMFILIPVTERLFFKVNPKKKNYETQVILKNVIKCFDRGTCMNLISIILD